MFEKKHGRPFEMGSIIMAKLDFFKKYIIFKDSDILVFFKKKTKIFFLFEYSRYS